MTAPSLSGVSRQSLRSNQLRISVVNGIAGSVMFPESGGPACSAIVLKWKSRSRELLKDRGLRSDDLWAWSQRADGKGSLGERKPRSGDTRTEPEVDSDEENNSGCCCSTVGPRIV